jgi:hypothetical protein
MMNFTAGLHRDKENLPYEHYARLPILKTVNAGKANFS